MTSAGFDWSASVIWEGPGAIVGSEERLSADRLDRARYAEFLTNYLATEGKQRNYVLNLNAEWGAGKTWFIKRWYMELKPHYPTVYIDAWQQDFSDDPLLTVISSIIDQLKEVAGKDNTIPEGMRQRLLGLFKVGGKLALKAAIKKAGLEEDDFSLEGEDANQLVDALCSNQKERYESIQYLKKEIRQWVEGAVGLSNGELDYPAFILIDELDRCRPSYAVEMLETIKHIFDIPGVVFVLATDTEQLQHAIKVIYGEDFDAQSYLSRFFRRRFYLKQYPSNIFIRELIEKNIDFYNSKSIQSFNKTDSLVSLLSMVIDAFNVSAREMESFIDCLSAALSSANQNSVDIIYLSFLLALHNFSPKAYVVFRDSGTSLSKTLIRVNEKQEGLLYFKSRMQDPIEVPFLYIDNRVGIEVFTAFNNMFEYIVSIHDLLFELEEYSLGKLERNTMHNIPDLVVRGNKTYDSGARYHRLIESKKLSHTDYVDLVELSTLLL